MAGKDVGLDKVLDLTKSFLVKKFSRRRVSLNTLINSMDQTFCVRINFVPMCHLLAKGWCGFDFRWKEDALDILKGIWFMDSSPLSLKP